MWGWSNMKTTKWEEFNNLMDRYIRYAGDWHLSGCSFVFYDQGVCNCKTSQNKKVIKSFIQELMIDKCKSCDYEPPKGSN